jgi:hypothetical protein
MSILVSILDSSIFSKRNVPLEISHLIGSFLVKDTERENIMRYMELHVLPHIINPLHPVRVSAAGTPCTSCYFAEMSGNARCDCIHFEETLTYMNYSEYKDIVVHELPTRISISQARDIYLNIVKAGPSVHSVAYNTHVMDWCSSILHNKRLLCIELLVRRV